jgi:hypothetical protein
VLGFLAAAMQGARSSLQRSAKVLQHCVLNLYPNLLSDGIAYAGSIGLINAGTPDYLPIYRRSQQVYKPCAHAATALALPIAL